MTEASQHEFEQTTDYAERRARRAAERSNRTRSRVPVYSALAIAALVLVLAGAEAFATAGRVHPGVSVAGVEIGGMIPEKAEISLAASLAKLSAEPVVVSYGEDTWSVTGEEIGLTYDNASTVADAMAVGREGGPFAALGGRLISWVSGVKVDPRPQIDQEKTDAVLDTIAAGTDVAPVDASVRIDGTEAAVVPGKDGMALDRQKASAADPRCNARDRPTGRCTRDPGSSRCHRLGGRSRTRCCPADDVRTGRGDVQGQVVDVRALGRREVDRVSPK